MKDPSKSRPPCDKVLPPHTGLHSSHASAAEQKTESVSCRMNLHDCFMEVLSEKAMFGAHLLLWHHVLHGSAHYQNGASHSAHKQRPLLRCWGTYWRWNLWTWKSSGGKWRNRPFAPRQMTRCHRSGDISTTRYWVHFVKYICNTLHYYDQASFSFALNSF